MRTALAFSIVGVVLAAAMPAHADWQATSWGQTLDEVLAADPSITQYEDSEDEVLAWKQVGAGATSGVAELSFADGKLSKVITWLDAGYYTPHRDVLSVVMDRFGAPSYSDFDGKTKQALWFWRDGPSGNNVRLVWDAEGYRVTYTPILSADDGL